MELLRKSITEEYIYTNDEEKTLHKEKMESKGFEDSGQCRKDINMSFSNPNYKIYGRYHKYEF